MLTMGPLTFIQPPQYVLSCTALPTTHATGAICSRTKVACRHNTRVQGTLPHDSTIRQSECNHPLARLSMHMQT